MRRVTHERHDLYSIYRIDYQDVDAVTPLVVRLIPARRPLLRLEHSLAVWQREPER